MMGYVSTGIGAAAGFLAASGAGQFVATHTGGGQGVLPVGYQSLVFQPDFHIRPHTVVLLDNRPEGLHRYHRLIQGRQDVLQREQADGIEGLQTLGAGIAPDDLSFLDRVRNNEGLKREIARGLREGRFKDSTKIRGWLRQINGTARLKEFGLPALELVQGHAETQINELSHAIMNEGRHPAGIVLSGSPKMLSELVKPDPDSSEGGFVFEDEAVRKTIELARYALTHQIPILGICFGLHLLTFAKYGIVPEWLTIPEDMTVRLAHERHGAPSPRKEKLFLSVTPGQRQMIYGPWLIVENTVSRAGHQGAHPVLRHATRVRGLKSHSQFIPYPHPGIPRETVLAISAQHFRSRRHTTDELVRHVVEVIQYGPYAFATQSHPELDKDLLSVLTFIPPFPEILRREGHDLNYIRTELGQYNDEGFSAGARFGFNWAHLFLLRRYLEGFIERGGLDRRQRQHVDLVLRSMDDRSERYRTDVAP